MKLLITITFASLSLSLITNCFATEYKDQYGTTNPVEESIEFQLEKLKTSPHDGTLTVLCWKAHELRKASMNKKALPVLLECAKRGHDISMLDLASMYELGTEVQQSYKQAAKWLKKSSDRGFSTAQLYYGIALLTGKGVKKNVAEGKSLIQKAAAQEDHLAINLINSNYDIETVIPDGDQKTNQTAKTLNIN
jgi:TPR repeat protein